MNPLQELHLRSTRYDASLSDWGGSLLSLAIRLYVGWQFLKSGLTKIEDWESTRFLFAEEYSVPILPSDAAAVLGTFGELAFPLLLFVGLFSRPAALGLFVVNAVALISYPALFEFACPAAVNDHLTWGALLLVVVAFGPGRLALDTWLNQRNRVTRI